MLSIVFKFIFTSVLLGAECGEESLTQYYENLIKVNTEESDKYTLPTRNEEFTSDDTEPQDYGTFDFIIVGAGSAGSVLATRLTEIGHWTVLLLEAGGEETEFSQIPAMMGYLQFSRMNWGYYTTPQKNSCLGMKNQQCVSARGKVVGGSSSINYLFWVRGNSRDYDRWADLGNPGWSYEEVIPYFKKSEKFLGDGDPGYHGYGGPMNVARSLPPLQTFDRFLKANQEMGLHEVDYNGASQFGVSLVHKNIKNGKRQSTGKAYLSAARLRGNLNLTTEALVTKILLDEKNKVAIGVEFVKGNKKFKATATKEVIVSGGALNSPQLLMLSGIGPRDELEKFGIEVVKELPVGKRLEDHMYYLGLFFRSNFTAPPPNLTEDISRFLQGFGPLTVSLAVDEIAFPEHLCDDKGAPLVEYIYAPPTGSRAPFQRLINYNDEVMKNFFDRINPSTDLAIYISMMHLKSRGSLTLKSADPLDFPNIDVNYFSDPSNEDLEDLYRATQYALELARTNAFKKLNLTFLGYGDLCNEHQEFSKEFWFCMYRLLTATMLHTIGTTNMGPNEKTSVVDHELRVHGFKNLRVVDAGVMPSHITAHPNPATIMIAEKISDVIKKEHFNKLRSNYNKDVGPLNPGGYFFSYPVTTFLAYSPGDYVYPALSYRPVPAYIFGLDD